MPPADAIGLGEDAPARRVEGRLIARAVRNRRAKAVLVTLGVMTSALLAFVTLATRHGLVAGVTAYAGQQRIDLWITRRGTDNLIRSSAMLKSDLVDEIASLPGVREVSPLLRGFVSARSQADEAARSINLLAIGYRAPDGLGGPPRIQRGRAPESDREVVLDRAAAYRLKLRRGSEVFVGGRAFRLVGLTTGTNLLATQFAFFHADALARTSGLPDRVSFIAVELAPDADLAAVTRRIESALPQVAVLSRETFVANNVREVASGFRPMQTMVLAVSIIAAGVLLALLVQGAVEERSKDIAVLLALGARAATVATAVVVETLLLVTTGCLLGVAAVQGLRFALGILAPAVEIVPRPGDVLVVLPVFLAVAVLASLLPLQRLRTIDPLEAFRP